MKLALAILTLGICGTVCSAQTRGIDIFRASETVRLTGTSVEHQAKLAITTGEFDPLRHRIVRRNEQGKIITLSESAANSITFIDSRPPLGVGGELPATEIRSMSVSFDGVKVDVPKKFYADCYNPNFQREYWGTRLSDNGQSLLVFMAGGQSKTRYQVIWIFRKDRQHARFFNNCAECDHRDILSFFKEK